MVNYYIVNNKLKEFRIMNDDFSYRMMNNPIRSYD